MVLSSTSARDLAAASQLSRGVAPRAGEAARHDTGRNTNPRDAPAASRRGRQRGGGAEDDGVAASEARVISVVAPSDLRGVRQMRTVIGCKCTRVDKPSRGELVCRDERRRANLSIQVS